MIMSTVSITIIAENNDISVRIRVTTKMTQREKPNDDSVSFQIVRYCS